MIDIHSKGTYPSDILSNFVAYEFIVDGIPCASMKGFLQSLKFRRKTKQNQICRLTGKEAKNAPGRLRNLRWKLTQTLYWNGVRYKRDAAEYQKLITRAYDALFDNADFRVALKAAQNAELCHSIGRQDSRTTVLTESEFIRQLYRLRSKLQEEGTQDYVLKTFEKLCGELLDIKN